jgi:hypothetical protein
MTNSETQLSSALDALNTSRGCFTEAEIIEDAPSSDKHGHYYVDDSEGYLELFIFDIYEGHLIENKIHEANTDEEMLHYVQSLTKAA